MGCYRIEAFQNAAIAWFNDRFGINFVGFPEENGIIFNGYAELIPLAFSGKYRVLSSNGPLFPFPIDPLNPPVVQLAERRRGRICSNPNLYRDLRGPLQAALW